MLIAEFLREATSRLTAARVDAPRRSAEILAGHVLGLDRVGLILHEKDVIPDARRAELAALTARRAGGEPVALLTGIKEFYGRPFTVTPDTLIPRPETELLVEYALAALPDPEVTFADPGTGTGCIAITLACERPRWRGVMLDIAPGALKTARANARELGVAERLLPVLGDMRLLPLAAGSLDCCISNPPYIGREEHISREVRDFEPQTALFSGEHGLLHLKTLISRAAYFLRPGGLLILEHGAGQGKSVAGLLQENSCWKDIKIHNDFSNLNRFCSAAARKRS